MPLDDLAHAGRALGVRFRREHTGGGCTAYTALLEGGAVLVVTDDGLTPDLDGPLTASLYRSPDDWADSGCEPAATTRVDGRPLAPALLDLLDLHA